MGASTILRAAAIAALLVGSAARARADGTVLVVGAVSPSDRDIIVDAIVVLSACVSAALSTDACEPLARAWCAPACRS